MLINLKEEWFTDRLFKIIQEHVRRKLPWISNNINPNLTGNSSIAESLVAVVVISYWPILEGGKLPEFSHMCLKK